MYTQESKYCEYFFLNEYDYGNIEAYSAYVNTYFTNFYDFFSSLRQKHIPAS
jgi:hypothetical protein